MSYHSMNITRCGGNWFRRSHGIPSDCHVININKWLTNVQIFHENSTWESIVFSKEFQILITQKMPKKSDEFSNESP